MRANVRLVTTTVVLLGLLLGCAPTEPTVTPLPIAPTVPPKAAPVATPVPAAPTPTPIVKIKRGGVLRVGFQSDWMGFDPPTTQGVYSSMHMVFDGLLRWRPDDKGIWGPVPGLAAEWELQGNTGTFKLRKGVKLHDGTEFDAQVAKWNFDRMLKDPKSRVRSMLEGVQSVEVVDNSTIKVNLKAPLASLPAILTLAWTFIASKDAFEKMGLETFDRNPVGSGPFQFVEWKSADHVTLKRFDRYWETGADGQPIPYLDGIVYRLLIDDTVRILELKAGNIDLTHAVAGKDVPSLKANPDLVYLEAPWGAQAYRVGFNLEKGPFTSVKLRQAVAHAIDRENIAKVLGLGQGVPAKYHLLPGSIGYDESVLGYSFSPEKARQALVDGGLASGADVVMIAHSRPLDVQQAQMLKQMFDAANIRTTLEIGERASNVRKREAGDFQFTTLVNPANVDPDIALSFALACGEVGNWTRYCNPEFDKCLVEGRSTYERTQRHEIYKRCQSILYNDVPDNYFWFLPYNYAYHKKVQGFGNTWTEYFEFRYTWLQQ